MAKRFKNFRNAPYDDEWGNDRNEYRQRDRQKGKNRENRKFKRERNVEEKFYNFKDFRESGDWE